MRDDIKITPTLHAMIDGFPVPPLGMVVGNDLYVLSDPEVAVVQKNRDGHVVVVLQPKEGKKVKLYGVEIKHAREVHLSPKETTAAAVRLELTAVGGDQVVAQLRWLDGAKRVEETPLRCDGNGLFDPSGIVDLGEVGGVTVVLEPEKAEEPDFVPRFGMVAEDVPKRPIARVHYMTRSALMPANGGKGASMCVSMTPTFAHELAAALEEELNRVSFREAEKDIEKAPRAVYEVKTVDEKTGAPAKKPEFKIPTREEMLQGNARKFLGG